MILYIILPIPIFILSGYFLIKLCLSDENKRRSILSQRYEHDRSQSYRFSRDRFCEICLETTKNISTKSNFFIINCILIGLVTCFIFLVLFFTFFEDYVFTSFETRLLFLTNAAIFIISTCVFYIKNKPKFICSSCDYVNFASQVELAKMIANENSHIEKKAIHNTLLFYFKVCVCGFVFSFSAVWLLAPFTFISSEYFDFYLGDWVWRHLGLDRKIK